jgi:cytochrome d ubiquinol oxidase subunit I
MALSALASGDIAPRAQMGMSLGWHIVLACLGVGLPALVVFAEWRGQRTGLTTYRLLARRWARVLGVLFAVGAVSGTILSFEMGLLWSGLMDHYGSVIGLPFTIEGFAFFIEAIFLGVYLYGWDRLSPRAHLLTGVPIVIAGIASAFFVVTANSWMNSPTGFTPGSDGKLIAIHPWRAMFNDATGPETTHLILAAFMVTSFLTASVYAVAILRGRNDAYHRLGLRIGLGAGAVAAPIQVVVGDWAARYVAAHQPVKLAAMEGLYRSGTHADLAVGGFYSGDQLNAAIHIPSGLSLLLHYGPGGYVPGLESVDASLRPPVALVHLSFDAMVGLGFGLLALGAWFGWSAWRHHELPRSPWFLRATAISGVAAVIAMEAGWIVTEVGRQPWVVYGLLKTSSAVNPAPGIAWGLPVLAAVYLVLTGVLVAVLRRMVRLDPVPVELCEADIDRYQVV